MMNQARSMGRSCGCRDHRAANERGQAALLHRIQSLSFAMTETVLYLDAYPQNCMALRYFRRVRDELTRATKEYESQYGPLTAAGDMCEGTWTWATQPWPWQMEV